jgi:hypothetical protein
MGPPVGITCIYTLDIGPLVFITYMLVMGPPVYIRYIIHTLPTTQYLPKAIGKCTLIYYTIHYGPICWYHMYP